MTYIVKWHRRGLTKRRFEVTDKDRVLALLIAGQQMGYGVRVEILTDAGLRPVALQ